MTTVRKQFLGWVLIVAAVLSAITFGWRQAHYNDDHEKWTEQAQVSQMTFEQPPPEPKPPSTSAYLIGIVVCAVGAFACLNSVIADLRKGSAPSTPDTPST